ASECNPTPASTSTIVAPCRIILSNTCNCGCRYSPYQRIDSPISASSGRYCTIPARVSATALNGGRSAGGGHGASGGTRFGVASERADTTWDARRCANSPSAAATPASTSSQPPRRVWRKSRNDGYHGLSSRPSSQRQSQGEGSNTHAGLPNAPAM